MAHQSLGKGELSDGTKFHFMHHRNEVHVYWPDGEYSATQLHAGDDPQDVANNWKEEILSSARFSEN